MKKIWNILMIAVILTIFCGCAPVSVSVADELVYGTWRAQTVSGICAELELEQTQATFSVCDGEGKAMTKINGAYAIDSKNLYITDTRLCRTFTFGYKVYADRAELEYQGETLTFYPLGEGEAQQPYT